MSRPNIFEIVEKTEPEYLMRQMTAEILRTLQVRLVEDTEVLGFNC